MEQFCRFASSSLQGALPQHCYGEDGSIWKYSLYLVNKFLCTLTHNSPLCSLLRNGTQTDRRNTSSALCDPWRSLRSSSQPKLRTPQKMAYIEAILREPQIFQSFQKRFQYLESSGAILARSTRHRFGKSRIPKKLSQNRSKSAQNCSKLLTSAQNCSKSLTSAQNCMKFAFKSHIFIIISTQYSNILAILREIGANIQYQYLETAKTILCGVLKYEWFAH